ncbi:hypothetical protein F5148DRAFT_1222356 [Russula earlei]|uniref:Uncharacterized protein n=1 Tax=Russula earlei TaxID=71964 RepID=A0ACC0U239_9AGAM|nr:hypothetical protein F5148DRAFT_1222356 [Russula earlei]
MRCDQPPTTTKKPQPRRSHSSSQRRKSGIPRVPTADQWKSWKRMQFCIVNDPRNGGKITFFVGEDILVLNHNWRPDQRYDMCDSWVGKILDIRGNSPRNTWVVVQWYFSGKDIEECKQAKGGTAGVDTSIYGKFERSLSQDRQVISSLSINGKATVVEFDETSSVQEPIPAECFYTRRAYNSLFGSVRPTVHESITCICGRPYKPDEPDPMHFCPRLGCKRWYHESCLQGSGYISDKSSDELIRQPLDIPQSRISRVPPDLFRLACTPVIRGGSTYGVSGNVKAVCEAREWTQLYSSTPWPENCPRLLMNGITLDRWLDGLDGVEVEELIYPDDENGSESFFAEKRFQRAEASPPFECPSCGKPV